MAIWNIDVPRAEYFGPLPADPRGVVSGDLAALIRELEHELTVEIAIDSETTGLVVFSDQVLYWSLAFKNRRCTLHASLLPHFRHLFEDPNKIWIFAGAKFDMHMFANMGMPRFTGRVRCTQVMHSLLFEEMSHRLKDMAKHLLGWRWSDFQDTFGRITKEFPPLELIRKAERENFPLLIEYAANDAWGTLGVHNDLQPRLQSAQTHSLFRTAPPFIETLWDLFTKVESPYTKVLWKNERNGILLDREEIGRIEPKARREIEKLEQDICKDVGWAINPGSTAQLCTYFVDYCRIPPLKLTKGGVSGNRKPSIDEGYLEHCAFEVGHPVAKKVLDWRHLSKLYGTYIQGLYSFTDAFGRIHTRFNQDITRTGRLSSADPNLQNIPTSENDKWGLRALFIAPPGRELIVADYNQLEMRLLAAAAREKTMIDIFLRGWDIHMGNATMMMKIPYDEIKDAKSIDKKVKEGLLPDSYLTERVLYCLAARAKCKNTGFGLNYGMGAGKLAADLDIPRAEAEATIRLYKNTYPAVDLFFEEAVTNARQTGYSFTVLGRRRNLPSIQSSRRDERARAERQAINVEIQGTAADIMKVAQVRLDEANLEYHYGCLSLLNIHDELIHECPTETAVQAQKEITEWMEHPLFYDLDVPLTVAVGRGQNWKMAK